MKLPKQLAKDGVESGVQSILEKEVVDLYAGSKTKISVLKLSTNLRRHLFFAKAVGEMVVGYEDIEESLAKELQGLKKKDNEGDRVSRLLIVTNDGSPRFYRELEFLKAKQGDRVMICLLDVDSSFMANILSLKGATVKAILLNRKKSVIDVFKSLLPS